MLLAEEFFVDLSLMIFDAVNDLRGHHLHLMHPCAEEQSQVGLVRHLTRKEAMLSKTYDGEDLQHIILMS